MNDDLYEHIWRVYYRCYFQELTSQALSRRYAVWDIGSSILLLLTVFGSLGLGVAFWNNSKWGQYWITVTAIATVVALGNLIFSVSSAKQSHISLYNEFSQIRSEIEAFMDGMNSGITSDEEIISSQARNFDDRFLSAKVKTSYDFVLFNRKFQVRVQNQLDAILETNGYNLIKDKE